MADGKLVAINKHLACLKTEFLGVNWSINKFACWGSAPEPACSLVEKRGFGLLIYLYAGAPPQTLGAPKVEKQGFSGSTGSLRLMLYAGAPGTH